MGQVYIWHYFHSQYRAQILRRAHEIERELEEDLDMLERVKYEADQEKNVSAEKRKVAQQYAQVIFTYGHANK